jgi:hypothetical protein
MTDGVFLDVGEPEPRRGRGRKPRSKPEPEPKKAVIPVVPKRPTLTDAEIRRGVSNRARSAANLKIDGYSYQEIADTLELKDAAEARKLTETVLAAIHPTSDLETLRIVVSARAERLLQRSMAMASADYLIDQENGEKIANLDRLRWHQQAAADLMNYATITGAKAPAKLEITPGEADMDALVHRLLARGGHEEIQDAEVIELDDLPPDDEDS